MSDPAIIFVAGAVQTVLLAIVAGVLKLWGDRNHAATQQSIEVIHRDVNGKMAELIKVTGQAEKAKGKLEGAAEEKANQA